MATEINQSIGEHGTRLSVRGEMMIHDALVLENLVKDAVDAGAVTIDLADLSFLDSESAAVLKRIDTDPRVQIAGIEIFLQSVVNSVENRDPEL